MKVLDLQCSLGHTFEAWFGSEADFVDQRQRSLVQCPMCGDPSVVKKLSAPRLSLSGSREPQPEQADPSTTTAPNNSALAQAWFTLAQKLAAETTDVGCDFAEEAHKMHYGEVKARGIRGTATLDETHALADEGIEVLAFPMPMVSKEQLQ